MLARGSLVLLLAVVLVVIASCRKAGPPYGIDEAIRTFKVESGFHVEKFASEPMVESPVAMDIAPATSAAVPLSRTLVWDA